MQEEEEKSFDFEFDRRVDFEFWVCFFWFVCLDLCEMAKTGVVEIDSRVKGKVTEGKKELQRLVRAIVEEEDCAVETVDRAVKTLVALKDCKLKKSLSVQLEPRDCPEHFRCPISQQLMKDPVIVATGKTYDRHCIQALLDSGHGTCPQTQQVLSHTNLIPNDLVRSMISQWCKNEGINLPSPPAQGGHEDVNTPRGKVRFEQLLKKLSSPSASEQNKVARELRQLSKRTPSFRALFGKFPESISQLLAPLSQDKANWDNEIQEDLITTILNISIHDENKKVVVETPIVIPLLIESLRTGTTASKSNAAAALFTLSALDSNKVIIGKSGAFQGLVDLLEEGQQSAMKDAASAIFNLCMIHDNRGKAVEAGAVKVILKKIADRILVDELLAILAILANHQRAVDEMGELGAVPCMLSIIREENACARNKENCITIIHSISLNDRTKWREIREEENANRTISHLVQNGTSRARRKATGILERVNRAVNLTHTA